MTLENIRNIVISTKWEIHPIKVRKYYLRFNKQ